MPYFFLTWPFWIVEKCAKRNAEEKSEHLPSSKSQLWDRYMDTLIPSKNNRPPQYVIK